MSRTGVGRYRRVLLGMLAAVMLVGVVSSSALAVPTGVFAKFAQCPTGIPVVKVCQYVEVTSGEIAIGPLQVPIDQPIILQSGAILTGSSNFNEYFLLPAVNGETVSPTKLEVPGGLASLLGCPSFRHDRDYYWHRRRHDLCFLLSGWAGRVTATFESVAGETNPAIVNYAALTEEKGIALTFPARIRLQNPLLGEACYLGSESSPIELHFTDGTTSPPPPNQPITGKLGTPASEVENGYEASTITQNTLVDNSFSVPPAEGCGGGTLSSILDPLIDKNLGLESPAGHNTIILNATNSAAEAEAVLASEKFPAKTTPPSQNEENTQTEGEEEANTEEIWRHHHHHPPHRGL